MMQVKRMNMATINHIAIARFNKTRMEGRERKDNFTELTFAVPKQLLLYVTATR